MSEANDIDLKKTQELFDFLQGKIPEGTIVSPSHRPKLTPEQAWTVVWYLGNQYWQVTDRIERCCVCSELYHTWQGGSCLDFGKAPYNFCEGCFDGEEFMRKVVQRNNPDKQQRKEYLAKP